MKIKTENGGEEEKEKKNAKMEEKIGYYATMRRDRLIERLDGIN